MLAAHAVGGVGVGHRPEHRDDRVLERFGIPARRWLHRSRAHDLHQVVHDDVAQCPDGVVEVAAIGNPEVLRHRDLDRGEVVAVPHRLEHDVREAQIEDLTETHEAQEVVDAIHL